MDRELFELLQVAIGRRKSLHRSLSSDEWEAIYLICELHNVLGVAFSGIQKLPEEQLPPSEFLANTKAYLEIKPKSKYLLITIIADDTKYVYDTEQSDTPIELSDLVS